MERGVCADPEVTKALMRDWIERYETDDFFLWAVEFTGQMIGTVNLHDIDRENRRCEIGFSIGSKWWNQGIMTEALRRIVAFSFDELKLNRLEAQHDKENPASGRVMAHVGMHYEGTLRQRLMNKGRYVDVALYAILRSDPRL